MSKSYKNTIDLSDSITDVKKKVQGMFTDPKRIRRNDPGHPDKCNVLNYYSVFAPEKKEEIAEGCKKAEIGCTECKKMLADILVGILSPIQEKRNELLKEKDKLKVILQNGKEKAQKAARETLKEAKEAMFKK